ncbi:MAG: glycosyltransferase, partial [Candidatus Aenigmarchaeota archaeon]|nr:glycosyltransferase [Candidatus Aenigmarchaeota archaeon]
MNILVFNWRDIKNPASGGAEVYTHQIFKRLVSRGHSVTLFTSSFPNAPSKEIIDDITVIRSGSKYTVYSKAKKFYKNSKQKFDIVVDEINTIPFFT